MILNKYQKEELQKDILSIMAHNPSKKTSPSTSKPSASKRLKTAHDMRPLVLPQKPQNYDALYCELFLGEGQERKQEIARIRDWNEMRNAVKTTMATDAINRAKCKF